MATLTIAVLPTNEHAPSVASSFNSFTGYIYENSRLGIHVNNEAGSSALKLLVSDEDQVCSSNYDSFVVKFEFSPICTPTIFRLLSTKSVIQLGLMK